MKPKHRVRRHAGLRLAIVFGALAALTLTLPGRVSDLLAAHAGGAAFHLTSGTPASPATPASPSPSPSPTSSKHPFGTAFRTYVAGRESRVGAAVLDLTTGKLYIWHAHQTFDTGSIVKVQIGQTVLHRAQTEHRTLTQYERDNMVPMIEQSDNDAATRLWNEVGGTSGVGAYDREVGMTHTTPDYHWGLTTTTAPDNVKLLRNLVRKSKLLIKKRQDYLLNLMEHVTDWERWGVSAGPTEGSTVALKNGWLPESDERQWIINSIGYVKGDGREYCIAVLTDENPSEEYGIATIQHISHFAWNGLKP